MIWVYQNFRRHEGISLKVVGILAILFLSGCFATFQTAQTLKKGESSTTLGGDFLTSRSAIPVIMWRRGLNDHSDRGLSLNGCLLKGDLKIRLCQERGIRPAVAIDRGVGTTLPSPLFFMGEVRLITSKKAGVTWIGNVGLLKATYQSFLSEGWEVSRNLIPLLCGAEIHLGLKIFILAQAYQLRSLENWEDRKSWIFAVGLTWRRGE